MGLQWVKQESILTNIITERSKRQVSLVRLLAEFDKYLQKPSAVTSEVCFPAALPQTETCNQKSQVIRHGYFVSCSIGFSQY